ncbi:MAG: MarR family transcriptional regulator [Candidatus Obscuribacter sp.]|nr:MarR family transcriptional regulator [Candidatus Obscuribacter sp.]MBP6349314.1 MarR family transcriptional regulator [Candidatus Obscuribacter sp.]MBP6592042.1 MarR family transcriptional regulator [Candidatus Obscuribacter sp.]MBP7575436.1 MarR family transcriptional regulator [Candidatus Obscuribacter sp.]
MITRPLGDVPEKTQDALLLYLKRRGELSVSDLCELLGITSMAVRRHLAHLQAEGLIETRMVRQSRGRPNYKYKLAAKAETLFPSATANMAEDLLAAVMEQSGAQGVMDLLALRNKKRMVAIAERIEGMDLRERVLEVTRIFSEDGYMTEWEELPDGNFLIYQRHCAVHDLANKFRQVCTMEPDLMQNILKVKVTREKYILRGDALCAYLVHKE